MKKSILFLLALFFVNEVFAQQPQIPDSYSNLSYDADGRLFFEHDNKKYFAETPDKSFSIEQFIGKPKGTDTGVELDFGDFSGTITYGLIPYGKAPHPLPVFRKTAKIENGKVAINIKDDFKYPYDFVDWKENGYLNMGYRLTKEDGTIVFDGVFALKGIDSFEVIPAILEGPFIHNVTDSSVTISCKTTLPAKAELTINGKTYKKRKPKTDHVWNIDDLDASKKYEYTVNYGVQSQSYHFKTALSPGSRDAFVFAYSSDSRHATGGGERKILGANTYIMKKVAALAYKEDAKFIQFTGDMINGYLNDKKEMNLQYYNWKKAVEPFWHYMPYYVGMGNHEAFGHVFRDEEGNYQAFIDGFPYDTYSAESLFADNFINPKNGPISEDNNKYDPNPKRTDFPSYKENVFHYTYGNVAMIVLNSDYWYAPSVGNQPSTSGNLHGYFLNNQMKWLRQVISKFEKDADIDHIFVTQHTPMFPNGGHSDDDMWYSGDNSKRPYIAGKPVKKGIIERRDEYLDILINESEKVVAVLTGDEHNYNWLKLTPEVPIYPEDYSPDKLEILRPIYQINNGAAGAPYYGQEILPWSDYTRSFSVENALCLFYVEGDSITMKVYNPDTLNLIDEVELR